MLRSLFSFVSFTSVYNNEKIPFFLIFKRHFLQTQGVRTNTGGQDYCVITRSSDPLCSIVEKLFRLCHEIMPYKFMATADIFSLRS